MQITKSSITSATFISRAGNKDLLVQEGFLHSKMYIAKLYPNSTLSAISRRLFQFCLQTIRYVADLGFQIGVGEDLGMDQSSICRSVHNISERFVHIAVNRKEIHSFNVQATCDSKESCTSVCATRAGRVAIYPFRGL